MLISCKRIVEEIRALGRIEMCSTVSYLIGTGERLETPLLRFVFQAKMRVDEIAFRRIDFQVSLNPRMTPFCACVCVCARFYAPLLFGLISPLSACLFLSLTLIRSAPRSCVRDPFTDKITLPKSWRCFYHMAGVHDRIQQAMVFGSTCVFISADSFLPRSPRKTMPMRLKCWLCAMCCTDTMLFILHHFVHSQVPFYWVIYHVSLLCFSSKFTVNTSTILSFNSPPSSANNAKLIHTDGCFGSVYFWFELTHPSFHTQLPVLPLRKQVWNREEAERETPWKHCPLLKKWFISGV